MCRPAPRDHDARHRRGHLRHPHTGWTRDPPSGFPGNPKVIGSYWTRTNDPQVDLIGADREPVAQRIAFVGSVKSRDSQPFDERDLADLISHRSQVPEAGDATPLLAVSRSGMRVSSLTALGPQELLDAWR